MQQPTHRHGYGRNVGRRTVVARSNCSRMGVESYLPPARFTSCWDTQIDMDRVYPGWVGFVWVAKI